VTSGGADYWNGMRGRTAGHGPQVFIRRENEGAAFTLSPVLYLPVFFYSLLYCCCIIYNISATVIPSQCTVHIGMNAVLLPSICLFCATLQHMASAKAEERRALTAPTFYYLTKYSRKRIRRHQRRHRRRAWRKASMGCREDMISCYLPRLMHPVPASLRHAL